MATQNEELEKLSEYKYGFSDDVHYTFRSRQGLTAEVVTELSHMKGEPQWMLDFRLKALDIFNKKPMPTWGGDIQLNFDEITYYTRPSEKTEGNWDDVPAEIKNTFDKLGIPEAERKFLAGVGAQYESEMVYHSVQKHLEELGVIFLSSADGLRQYPDLFREHFGKVIPPTDNKFAACNSAVWSGGSFVYVPKGAALELPLHSVAWLTGGAHFGRVLIVVDDGASATVVHETASPENAAAAALHAATVEVKVGKNAHLTFVELQSLGKNVWNFTHERVRVGANSKVDWIFVAQGTRLTKNFTEIDLDGQGATGKMSGYYFSDGEQHLDHDTQQNHNATLTTSDLLFKGALKDKSRSVWQGMIYVAPGSKSNSLSASA